MPKKHEIAIRGPSLIERFFDEPFFNKPLRLRDFFDYEGFGFGLPKQKQYEKDNKIYTEIALPGVNKDDIDAQIVNDNLEVRVKSSTEKKDEDKGYYESRSSEYLSRIPLYGVDADKLKAVYKDGVLTVSVPITEERKKKKIEIK